MTWLNSHEVENMVVRFADTDTPNLKAGAEALYRLMRWANSNSDGWHSWPKPGNAASSLMDLLKAKQRDYREDGCVSRAGESGVVEFTDATDAELAKVLRPIKAFLTRQKANHAEVFPPPPPPEYPAVFNKTVETVQDLDPVHTDEELACDWGNAEACAADNELRARYAGAALKHYAQLMGGMDEPIEAILSDLLNDLRHLCDALNLEFNAVADANHYEHELLGTF